MNTPFQKLDKIQYKSLIWILAISETIHNIEEAIWLPDLFQSINYLHIPVTPFQFRIAVIVITLFIYWVIYYFVKHENKLAKYLMCGALFLILFNVFMPHLISTIIMHDYVPGVISGIVLNLPVTLYLLLRGFKEKIFRTRTFVIGSVVFTIITVLLMMGSFVLGGFIEKMQ